MFREKGYGVRGAVAAFNGVRLGSLPRRQDLCHF